MTDYIFSKIRISDYWVYTLAWCDREFVELDLNSLCFNSSAHFEIPYLISSSGSDIHTHIKILNRVIDEIESTDLQAITCKQAQKLLGSIEPHSHIGLEGHEQIDRDITIFCIDNLSSRVRQIFLEIIRMQYEGITLYNELKKYLTEIYEDKRTAEKNKELFDIIKTSKTYKMELKHLQAESGFIYILSNSMMKDVYKVGFTERNPDVRAKEISRSMGLPADFLVEKYWRTVDPYIVEQRVHQELNSYHKGNEFFEGEFDEFINIISHVVQMNNN